MAKLSLIIKIVRSPFGPWKKAYILLQYFMISTGANPVSDDKGYRSRDGNDSKVNMHNMMFYPRREGIFM